jgi:NAD(P)H-hydrate repair Nnr-like enzyme with NAD(P)H-hydrate epimerase domain
MVGGRTAQLSQTCHAGGSAAALASWRAGLVSKGKDMKLFVIECGKGNAAGDAIFQLHAAKPGPSDVMAEAARRIETSGYEDWRVREFVTGASMPSALKYLRMQIEFVAEALLRLDRIPADFRSDTYWPCF